MKKILFCLMLSLSFTAVSFSQVPYYYYQVPSNTSSNLNDISPLIMGSTLRYFITGDNGTLLTIRNADSLIHVEQSNTTANLNGFFRSYGTNYLIPFFIFGNNGVILKSTNSSLIWIQQYSGFANNLYPGIFIRPSGSTSSWNYLTVGSNGLILKRKYFPISDSIWIQIQSGTSNDLKSINTISSYSEKAYIAGANGTILKSNDTGNTWIQMVSGTTKNLNCVFFKSQDTGIIVGDGGTILKSTNGGTNWVQKTSNTLQNLNSVVILNDSTICISGNKAALYSTNAGENWVSDAGVPQYNLYSCNFLYSNYYKKYIPFFVGEGGRVYKKTIDSSYHPNFKAQLKPGNINSYFNYRGVFDQNDANSNNSGFEWPKGSNKYAIFSSGLSIGAYVNGQLREAMASYSGEYSPGYCVNGNYYSNDYFKIYKVNKSDNAQTNWDWANWGQMVPFGAPFIDVNNNGIYEPAIDTPGVRNAKETIFLCMTDANQQSHTSTEGFGGGTLPLGTEIHLTAWAYDSPGLQDVQFISYDIINKSTSSWNSVKMGVFCDPDLGDANDDYIGCDTILKLGYSYNGTNIDAIYGSNPPSVGMTILRSPLNRSATPNVRLGMTSFGYIRAPSIPGPSCEIDPNPDPYGAYLMLSGYKKDSTCWLDPIQTPPKKTKYCYSGDPETNAGWTEIKGSIWNCSRDTTGTYYYPNPYGDRRFTICSGANNFNMIPGESQKFVIAQLIARGNSNLNSVTRLKQLCDSIRNFYEINFPIGINKISNTVPDKFNLFQNYPNPFNPTTKIKYQIVKNSFVTLKVYDLLGREVETLVNEYQQVGIYETQFPSSSNFNLSSGIYFYKIVSGENSAVKRMLMIK